MMSYGVSSCCEFLKRDAQDIQTNGSEGWILLNEYDLSLTGTLSGRYTSWEHKVPMICATLICWTSRSRAKSPNEDMIGINYSKKNKDYKQNEMNWISKNSKRIEKRRTYKKANKNNGHKQDEKSEDKTNRKNSVNKKKQKNKKSKKKRHRTRTGGRGFCVYKTKDVLTNQGPPTLSKSPIQLFICKVTHAISGSLI